MKKFVFKSFVYALMLILFSCSEGKVTQRILGAGDCLTCNGWSWNNGEASTIENNTNNDHLFSFKSTVSGELTFSHHMIPYYGTTYSGSLLMVSIGSKLYFQVTTSDGGTINYTKTSIGSIKAGEIITFKGRRYYVKDIKIVGTQGSSNQNNPSDEPSDPNDPWDF